MKNLYNTEIPLSKDYPPVREIHGVLIAQCDYKKIQNGTFVINQLKDFVILAKMDMCKEESKKEIVWRVIEKGLSRAAIIGEAIGCEFDFLTWGESLKKKYK